jgi:5-bromo-4-chloroindolyl phosphate hydrolysis protein
LCFSFANSCLFILIEKSNRELPFLFSKKKEEQRRSLAQIGFA